MTDDSQKNNDGSQDGSKKFEFNASDIPGLDLASDSPAPAQESPAGIPGLEHASDPAAASPFNLELSTEPAQQEPLSQDFALSPEAPAQAPVQEPTQKLAAPNPIEKVKEFSEKMPMEKVQVPAAFPFSLLIDGEMTPEEKEKLVDVLSRESMGIREVDLEPQFAANRILIPRISEYAGILLVQALRGTRARMRLGPADEIFSAHDAEVTSDPYQPGMRLPEPEAPAARAVDLTHSAEKIAITPDSKLPQLSDFDVIDTLLASAILNSNAVEAAQSLEYTDAVESLKRELKYKAYRKGAVGIVHFKAELQQLSLANQYRLTISGAAIRPRMDTSQASHEHPLETSH